MSEITKFCVCIFTYSGDAYALGQCIRALKNLRCAWPGMKIAVFDDGYSPLPYEPIVDYYEQTYFPRRGNLNGISCVQGELLCGAEMVRKFDAEIIVKLDCDTIIQGWSWMIDAFNESPKIGQVGIALNDAMDWASGMCNAWRGSCVMDALTVSGSEGFTDGIPEDIGITQCIRRTGHKIKLLRQDKTPVRGWKGICTGYDYQNISNTWNGWQLYKGYPIVTFGNRNILNDKDNARFICGDQMKKFLDVLNGGKGGLMPGEKKIDVLPFEKISLQQDRGKTENYLI